MLPLMLPSATDLVQKRYVLKKTVLILAAYAMIPQFMNC